MAATFQSVNMPLSPAPSSKDENMTSPTTPRPSTTGSHPPEVNLMRDDATTPTKASFGSSAMAAQKPLPTSPFPDSVQVPETPEAVKTPKRENSQHSRKSKDSDEMDMDDSDGAGEDGAGSDEESVNADGSRSTKKKKSQRFYCTDYPPCNLSFTRSEHLARHIRKHTGERPFQCHCSRRFSRLDNLRQHAQTVHVNEDIPIDSLAATGTRFQRQIRTDRVRQSGGRARASTAGSIGSAVRGHSKSLSTSSITSVGSIGSNYSLSDARRRPPPLVMADPRSRFSMESYREQPYYYRPPSPSDFSTPTSATFSTSQGSPRWGSGVASPISSHSRSHSMYAAGSRTPGRRLSVPSAGGNPFQSPHGANVRGPLFGPGQMNTSNNGAYSPGQTSQLASPTTSTSTWTRRDSVSSTSDEAWRRRTWHPDTRDYNGASRLNQVVSQSQVAPDTVPPPIVNPVNAPQQTLRLPGIESFDPIPRRPVTPPRRNPSPMIVDSEPSNPPALLPAADVAAEDRRNVHWDMSLHRGLTRLDINTPPRDSAGSWANETNQAIQGQAERAAPPPTVRFETEARVQPPTSVPPPPSSVNFGSRHQHTMSAPSITTPRDMKRHGWYHGPSMAHPVGETIPEGRPHVDRIVHPNVSAFQGFPAREAHPVIHQQLAPQQDRPIDRPREANVDSMRRLEALVAVATSEGSTAAAY